MFEFNLMLRIPLIIILFSWLNNLHSQTINISAIGFWNVENLYDTIDDPLKNDDDFTPAGANKWNTEKYRIKIDRLAEVIAKMPSGETTDGFTLLGLCEVENKNVLQDLVSSQRLKEWSYEFVLVDGPDARGIDPALIYNPVYFQPTKVFSFRIPMIVDTSHQTRNILFVKGLLLGEELVLLVNHWPSRRGGESTSRPNRISAARKAGQICDSIRKSDPETRIIIMGDFNDDPDDKSIMELTENRGFYNPMLEPFKKGIGTIAWKDNWNLFDQVLLDPSFLSNDNKGWKYSGVNIYNKDFLRLQNGNFKGYPHRTYNGSIYAGGYSDHFPVCVLLKRKIG